MPVLIRWLTIPSCIAFAPYRRREIRWLLTSRFPYRVIYYLEDDSIRIFAVLHAKRSERFWRERLS